jgi:hypothetical protein
MFCSAWSKWGVLVPILAAGAASLRAQPQAPAGLTVVSATKTQVQLTWTPGDGTATGYIVERKPLNGNYATALNSTAASATDTSIDPYTTYVYRIRGASSVGQSGPSNEVTVGPPPYGFNRAAAPPAAIQNFGHFGIGLRMVLDGNGDPALAYVVHDPNEDNDFSDSALYFVKWNRAAYRWNAPLKIATTAEVDTRVEHALSIARDLSNDMLGIAFEDHTNPDVPRIGLALSTDNGASWKLQTVAADSGEQASGYQSPSLAMNAGSVYMVFFHNNDGIRYLTGKETDDPKIWKSQLVPPLAGFESMRAATSLALDSAGIPGVAFIGDGDNGPAEGFWRAGSPSSSLALDNRGKQTDDADVKLTFFGTQPRLVFAGAADDNYFVDYSHTIWVTSSADGVTWSRAVNIPSDGNRSMDPPVAIASGSQGQTVVVTENNGGNLDVVSCGQPELSRTSDLQRWTTCGLATYGVPRFTASYPVVLFGGNDKLWVSFQQPDDAEDGLPTGVTVWREPPDWVFPPPPPQ